MRCLTYTETRNLAGRYDCSADADVSGADVSGADVSGADVSAARM